MSGPSAASARLTISPAVVAETIGLAALEVPGVVRVGRGGPPWRGLGRPSIVVRHRGDTVEVRLWIVARPNRSLARLGREVRSTVSAAVEQLLGLQLSSATVVIDGIGS